MVFRKITVWPGKRTQRPQHSRFRSSFYSTLKLVQSELRHLKAESVVIEAFVEEHDIRIDGWLRSTARPVDPGIILTFGSKVGPLRYPCDTYLNWQDNLRAIAMALQALRAVDRYGVTSHAEQYRGWTALPDPNGSTDRVAAARFVAGVSGVNVHTIMSDALGCKKALRAAAKALHPDMSSGDEKKFKKLQECKAILDGQPSGGCL